MEKEQVVKTRNDYKGKPMLIVLDNEHNFFDNFPGKAFPVWDDANELVSFIDGTLEFSGMANHEFPNTISVVPYVCIQSFRIFADTVDALDYLTANKAALGESKYKENLKLVKMRARNTRPGLPGGTYYDKLAEAQKDDADKN